MKEEKKMSTRKHAPYTAVKRWFAGHGITYKDVGEVINCSEATVQLKLNGGSDFYITEQIAICNRFGMDPAIFFENSVA